MIRGLKIILLFVLSVQPGGSQPDGYDYFRRLADSAYTLTRAHVDYDPAYYALDYPMGDVPAGKGVCSDVLIRAYRKLGTDLQQLVHEDMSANFHRYPDQWGASGPDPNIDHRRVPNLMFFFGRFGTTLPVSAHAGDYRPGDIVCWDLGNGISHIGLVANHRTQNGSRPLIIHNIGGGQVLEDCLFDFRIIGHFRYQP